MSALACRYQEFLTCGVVETASPRLEVSILGFRKLSRGRGALECETMNRLPAIIGVMHPGRMIPITNLHSISTRSREHGSLDITHSVFEHIEIVTHVSLPAILLDHLRILLGIFGEVDLQPWCVCCWIQPFKRLVGARQWR